MESFETIRQWLNNLDSELLLAANSTHSTLLDQLMWTISGKWTWIPLYVLLVIITYRKFGINRCLIILVGTALLIAVTNQTCAGVIRPVIARLRPSSPDNPLSEWVTLVNGYRGGHYGFPSCHAANTIALALFLSLLFKNRYFTVTILSWCLLVSYSRIYLGVHYPGDITGGYLVGGTFALLWYWIYKRALRICLF